MLGSVYNKFINSFEALLKYKYWHLYTALLTFFIVLLFNFPYYQVIANNNPSDFLEKIDRANHILKPTNYPEGEHLAKTQLRLTVPLIIKATGVKSVLGVFVIQNILGLMFLFITCLLSFRITNDKIISATITLAIGFIYAGKAAFVDTSGCADSFAYCFLLISLFAKNKPLILLSLLLAYFTDERALVASSFIAIYFFVEYLQLTINTINWSVFIKSRLLIIVISWPFCFLIRYALFKGYGLHTSSAGVDTVNIEAWPYLFWDGLQGFWLIVIGGLACLVVQKRFFIMSLTMICILLMIMVASMVFDLTRSIGYIFPVIFLCVYFLEQGVSKTQFRKIALICCLVSFLSTDSFFIFSTSPFYYQSLPLKVLKQTIFKK